MSRVLLVIALLLVSVPTAHAEWQIRPFLGLTLGSDTTVFPAEGNVGPRPVYGLSGGILGNIVGVEGDFGRWSDFLKSSEVVNSSVTTLMGNVTIALPRKMTEYTLRPYFGGGVGLVRMSVEETVPSLSFSRNMAGVDLGGGVTGFVNKRLGVSWDVRHFRARGRSEGAGGVGFSIGPEQLSFWRANMALAIRY